MPPVGVTPAANLAAVGPTRGPAVVDTLGIMIPEDPLERRPTKDPRGSLRVGREMAVVAEEAQPKPLKRRPATESRSRFRISKPSPEHLRCSQGRL